MLAFSQWGEILHHASFLRLKSLRLCDLKEGVANSEHKRIFKNARAKQPSVSSRPLRSVRGDLRGVVEGGIEHLRGVSGVADRTHADRHSYSAEGVGVNFSNISALWDTFTQGQLFARGFQHKMDTRDSDLGKSVSSLDNRVIGLRGLCVVCFEWMLWMDDLNIIFWGGIWH